MFDDRDLDAAGGGWTVPLGSTPGDVGRCRSCGAPVLWVTTPSGRRSPLDRDGVSHFATCPQRDEWRAGGARRAR